MVRGPPAHAAERPLAIIGTHVGDTFTQQRCPNGGGHGRDANYAVAWARTVMSASNQHFDAKPWSLEPLAIPGTADSLAHRTACVAIFNSNLPEFVTKVEREQFESFLDKQACPYFVVKTPTGGIVACGGYHTDPGEARLCWGLVERRFQGRGIGRFLLQSRLLRIHELCGATIVTMDTSQLTLTFFEPFGFREVDRIEHGYRAGLHKIEMELELDDRTAETLRLGQMSVRP